MALDLRSVSATKPARVAIPGGALPARADGEQPGVPEQMSRLGRVASSCQPRLAQGGVIGPRRARPAAAAPGCVRSGRGRPAVIERLGGELPGMVHAHERRRRAALALGRGVPAAAGPGGGRFVPAQRRISQGTIGGSDGRVERATRPSVGCAFVAYKPDPDPLRGLRGAGGVARGAATLHWATRLSTLPRLFWPRKSPGFPCGVGPLANE